MKKKGSELMQLWARRCELSKAEWAQLYRLVRLVLKQSRCSALNGLPLKPTHYIDEFFRDKVFLTTTKEDSKETELLHDNALKTFFCHYLKDVLDDSYLKRALPLTNEDDERSDDDGKKTLTTAEMAEFEVDLDRLSSKLDRDQAWALLSELDIETASQGVRLLLEFELDIKQARFFLLEAALKPEWVSGFLKAGLTRESVGQSAYQFLSENDKWVRLYLALHTCVDQKTHLPLKKLAENHRIPSYHHRARKLGISRRKGQFEEGYEETILGAWLLSLGLVAKTENLGAINVAFKILCWEASSLAKQEM
ncbi:MAG: hypothetical protein ABFS56_12005 [Pseudomonadota bacterium]